MPLGAENYVSLGAGCTGWGSILVCYCVPIERDGTPELETLNNHAAKTTHYEKGSVQLTTS